jgi:hypothetical protein
VNRGLDLLSALDSADAQNAAKSEDHAIQMEKILGFNHEFDHGFAIVVVMNIDAANVRVVV